MTGADPDPGIGTGPNVSASAASDTGSVKYATSIRCSRGCRLTVRVCGESISVSGNACPDGEEYGRQEATDPLRPLLTTVATDNPSGLRLAVRTDRDFPVSRMLEAMAVLDAVTARSPLQTGDVLVENLLGTGISVVARADLPVTSSR